MAASEGSAGESVGDAGDRRSPAQEHGEAQALKEASPQGALSVVPSISDAVVIKDGDLFLLMQPDGSVPLEGPHGYGLYCDDCRFLSTYVLKLGGSQPISLVASAARGFEADFQLTNPQIRPSNGAPIPQETVGIHWRRTVDGRDRALEEELTFHNFALDACDLPVELTFGSGFEPLFVVRAIYPKTPGRLHPPSWSDGSLEFVYDGVDGLRRSLCVAFTPPPDAYDGTTARFQLGLRAQEERRLVVTLTVAESPSDATAGALRHPRESRDEASASRMRSRAEWLRAQTEVRSDSVLLERVVERSLLDLRMLRSSLLGRHYYAAGIPWYATLFGRDSIIAALQSLAYDPEIAEDTLRLLAEYQSSGTDERRDAQPGKILHEYRVGELAMTGAIPYNPPFYGTVDATPLFLVLLAEHSAWTGRLDLFDELRPNVERALEWIDRYGDLDGDGYVEYESMAGKTLVNQGWKDSGDGIVDRDGSVAKPPIALVEVQGYVYRAKLGLAHLFEASGDGERGRELRQQAADLRERFNRDFWLEDLGIFALALQANDAPCAVVTSNPGHALWSGIADPAKARLTADRLMADDMFSGWGIRTLSSAQRGYNPVGYHLGSVWPHDNSIIAAGFRRYGLDEAATRVYDGIAGAATYFESYRLPELFAGYSKEDYGVPVRYPVACHPQAWAAGSVPYMLQALLGLVPEAFERRLRISRPLLPDFADRVKLSGVRVGDARVDVAFERSAGGVAVQVPRVEGDLEVIVEPSIGKG